jgi:hypothetical protein
MGAWLQGGKQICYLQAIRDGKVSWKESLVLVSLYAIYITIMKLANKLML